MDKPEFIIDLLIHVNFHVNPARIVHRIPITQSILGLKTALQKTFSDYRIRVPFYLTILIYQLSLVKGCNTILENDAMQLMNEYLYIKRRGIRSTLCNNDNVCQVCMEPLKTSGYMIVFYCHHIVHSKCVDQHHETVVKTGKLRKNNACPLCYP